MTDLHGPRAILFDLDETLMVEHDSIRATFADACAPVAARGIDGAALRDAVLARARALWHAAPTADLCRRIHISSWEGLHGDFEGPDPDLAALRAWIPTYRREAWTLGLADVGIGDSALAQSMADAFRVARRKHHAKFPDADDVLARLRPRFRLGIVTNGASDVQREKIRLGNLEYAFDAIVASGDLGVGKPDPSIFRHILGLLKLEASDVVMIGNSLTRDIAGARAAGIRSIWVDRENIEPAPPDCTRVTSLGEIPPLLM